MKIESVPENTRKLLLAISNAAARIGMPDGLILIGGTALALRAGHRLSEDLDFATADARLPVDQIAGLLKELANNGCQIIDATDPGARDEFINDGLDIELYQQDWLVDGVKLTFFSYGKNQHEIETLRAAKPGLFENIPVADIDTIAKTKAQVVTRRIKSRDLFDLAHLIEDGMIKTEDIIREMQSSDPHMTYETAVYRLVNQPIQADDEGLVPVGVSANITEIRKSLAEYVSRLEAQVARDRHRASA